VFAALAEFERDLIRERTAAGLAAARARGRQGGRPSVLTGHKLQVAREMYRSGEHTVAAICHDPWSEPGLDLPPPDPPRQLNLAVVAPPDCHLWGRPVEAGVRRG
jgi:hypothetical protein